MVRRTGPDEAYRSVYTASGVLHADGLTVRLCADADMTTPADVLTEAGDTIPVSGTSRITSVDANSRIPKLQYPADGSEVIYCSVNDGPVVSLPADREARIGELAGSITTLDSTTPKVDSSGRLNPITTRRRAAMAPIMTLLAGTDDETVAPSSCSISVDMTNTKFGRAWQMSMSGAVTAYAVMSPVSPATSGLLPFPPAQAVCMWIYLPDASKVTAVGVEMALDTGNTVLWSNGSLTTPAIALVNGWNLVRLKSMNGLDATKLASWGNLNRLRCYVITNAATTATIGHVWLECPERARLLFILDRGYKSFVTSGSLARLRAANIPVTWALDVTLLGTHLGDQFEVVTEADIASYAEIGDSISFHSWDGAVTSSKTAAEIRADTAKCVKWLGARGYAGRMFRAAWTQDLATNYAAAIPYTLGLPQSSVPSQHMSSWPPRDFANIERWSFYGRPSSEVDDYFTLWQKTYGLSLTYNHGINISGGNDATPTEFDYWMTKVEAALSAGWLEAVTFEQLWLESGGDFGVIGGHPVARFVDPTGATVSKYAL